MASVFVATVVRFIVRQQSALAPTAYHTVYCHRVIERCPRVDSAGFNRGIEATSQFTRFTLYSPSGRPYSDTSEAGRSSMDRRRFLATGAAAALWTAVRPYGQTTPQNTGKRPNVLLLMSDQ